MRAPRAGRMVIAAPVVDRYILTECLKTWLGVTAVLIVLTLGVGFARFIADAAAGELPVTAVFAIAGFSLLENMEIVLPASLLLAIMLTVGRLCRDNEMAALAAGGIGIIRLYRPFGLFAVLLAALAAVLSLIVSPQAEQAIERLRGAGAAVLLQTVEPGRFTTIDDGRAVFYAGAVDVASGRMNDVFIRIRGRLTSDGEGETIVTARTAVQERDPQSDNRILVLREGRRYEGRPGDADYRITSFAEHGVRIGQSAAKPESDDVAARSTATLLAEPSPAATAELHHRLGIPLSLLVLALLAVPLGYLPPRSGRYGKLVLGVLIYVAYANALRLGEVWLEESKVPPALGLWWVHGLVLALALLLLARRAGWRPLAQSRP